MDKLDIESLRLNQPNPKGAPPDNDKPPRHKPGQKFLKGPIPMDWLNCAARQGGHSLHVAIALWFLAGLTGSRTVRLSSQLLRNMEVSRYAGYRGVAALKEAGLISVHRHPGRSPIITLLAVPAEPQCTSDGRR